MSAVVKLDVEKQDDRGVLEYVNDWGHNIFDSVVRDEDLERYHPDVLDQMFVECCLHNNSDISEIDGMIRGELNKVWRSRLRSLSMETQLLLLQLFGFSEMKRWLRV
jgi:hypothetical protein